MSNISPKDLDKLFQQGSEQYDFEYNADAWDQMESLLEENDSKRRPIWLWFIGLSSIAIIVLVALFAININSTNQKNTISENNITTTVTDTTAESLTNIEEFDYKDNSKTNISTIQNNKIRNYKNENEKITVPKH